MSAILKKSDRVNCLFPFATLTSNRVLCDLRPILRHKYSLVFWGFFILLIKALGLYDSNETKQYHQTPPLKVTKSTRSTNKSITSKASPQKT